MRPGRCGDSRKMYWGVGGDVGRGTGIREGVGKCVGVWGNKGRCVERWGRRCREVRWGPTPIPLPISFPHTPTHFPTHPMHFPTPSSHIFSYLPTHFPTPSLTSPYTPTHFPTLPTVLIRLFSEVTMWGCWLNKFDLKSSIKIFITTKNLMSYFGVGDVNLYKSVAKLPCGKVTVEKLPCGKVTGNCIVSA